MAAGCKSLTLRFLLIFPLVIASPDYGYEEDTTLPYGLHFVAKQEPRATRQPVVNSKHTTQRGRGRGNVYLASRAYYTANRNSTFQLHRIIFGGDVQTNPGPNGNINKPPKYPCKECRKNVRANQDALLCAVCNSWSHAKCLGLTKASFKYYLDFPDIDWTCSLCNLPFTSVNHSFEKEVNIQVNTSSTGSAMEARGTRSFRYKVVSIQVVSIQLEVDSLHM